MFYRVHRVDFYDDRLHDENETMPILTGTYESLLWNQIKAVMSLRESFLKTKNVLGEPYGDLEFLLRSLNLSSKSREAEIAAAIRVNDREISVDEIRLITFNSALWFSLVNIVEINAAVQSRRIRRCVTRLSQRTMGINIKNSGLWCRRRRNCRHFAKWSSNHSLRIQPSKARNRFGTSPRTLCSSCQAKLMYTNHEIRSITTSSKRSTVYGKLVKST